MKKQINKQGTPKRVAELIEKTHIIIKELSPHNQHYFADLQSYMLLSSLFHDEIAVREQVYSMALDLREAESDGLTAEEFFGNNPQEMVKEILANTAFEPARKLLKLFAYIVGILFSIRFQFDFMDKGLVTLSPLHYLIDALLGLVGVLAIFWTAKQSVYRNNQAGKKVKWSFLVCFTLIFLMVTYRLLEEQFLATNFIFTLSPLWSLIIASLILCLMSYLSWQNDPYFRPFLVCFLAFYLVGLLRLIANAEIIKDEWFTEGLPVGILTIAIVLFFVLSFKLIPKNK